MNAMHILWNGEMGEFLPEYCHQSSMDLITSVNVYCSVVNGVIWGVLVESTLQLGSFDCFI